MDIDGNDGPDGASIDDLLQMMRRRLSPVVPPADPTAQLQGALWQDARLPRGGGLFGADYARFMADHGTPVRIADASTWLNGGQQVTALATRGSAGRLNPASFGGSGPEGSSASSAREAAIEPAPQPQTSATPEEVRGRTSPEGRAFVRRFELDEHTRQPNFDILPDDKGNPTFGYGHRVEPGERAALDAQLATLDRRGRAALIESMFDRDLSAAEKRVKDRLGPDSLKRLSAAQFDALVADSFNAGGGGALGPQMLHKIRQGDLVGAGEEFNAVWAADAATKVKTIMPGLVKRSLAQAAMFNRGDYNYEPTKPEIQAATQAAIAAHAPARKRP